MRSHNEPGFFEAQALIGSGAQATVAGGSALEDSRDPFRQFAFDAVGQTGAQLCGDGDRCCARLRPERSLQPVALQQQGCTISAGAGCRPSRENVQKALDFVRASRLRGGTDLQQALGRGLGAVCNGSHGECLHPAVE